MEDLRTGRGVMISMLLQRTPEYQPALVKAASVEPEPSEGPRVTKKLFHASK